MDLPGELAEVSGADARTQVAASGVAGGAVDFEAWVEGAGPDLMRFAQATARGLDPADLVQDALVAVLTHWSRLSEPGRANAYARRVVLNSHISRWRTWGRRVVSVEPLSQEAVPGQEAATDEVLTARQLLEVLPVKQRAAVFLRFYDDLTYHQIAEIIGCREATARSHVHRALTQLRSQLDKDPT